MVAEGEGGFWISTKMVSESEARADALAKCAEGNSKRCSITKAMCAPSSVWWHEH